MTAYDVKTPNKILKSPIKIVSLDCWGTIVTSDNSTWEKCARKIADYFCIFDQDAVENIKTISKRVNIELDILSGKKLVEYSQEVRVRAIIKALGFKPNKNNIKDVISIVNQVFLSSENPVSLIEQHLPLALAILKEYGHHIILLSNSGLIRGREMRIVLEKLNIITHIDGFIFSDEVGKPKPSLLIFEEINKYINENKINCQKHEVVHIGDNYTVDCAPAKDIGFKTLLVSDYGVKDDVSRTVSVCRLLEEGWFGDEVKDRYIHAIKEINESKPKNIKYISKYCLTLDDNGELIDEKRQELDFEVYSEMKYGVKSATKMFAKKIAEMMYLRMPGVVMSSQPPKFIDSKKVLMPASGYLSRYVQKYINQRRRQYGLLPAEIVPVERLVDNLFDYAALEPHTRNIGVFSDLDFPDIDYHSGPLVIVEDICVSGTFTKKMLQSIREVTTAELNFIYLIKVNKEVRKKHIHVEPMINSRYIKKLADIEPFIKRGDFLLTRKYYKMLLSSSIEELKNHLSALSKRLLDEITYNLELSKEDIYEKFHENYDFIMNYYMRG